MSARMTPRSPYDVLADYERRSLAHAVGAPEQSDAPGVWRGIGFRVGQRHLLGSIGDVNEILTLPSVTPVPGTRSWLLGVSNVRGSLVPVIDLASFIDGTTTTLTDNCRILLVRQAAGSVALLVDEVFGQRSLASEQLVGAGVETDPALARFVRETVHSGNLDWGLFNVASLVRSSEFQQAAL